MQPLFLYGVPGRAGGAATRIRDLLRMLRYDFDITVVLGHVSHLKNRDVNTFLDKLGIKFCLRKDVPDRVDGVALGICSRNHLWTSNNKTTKEWKGTDSSIVTRAMAEIPQGH